MNSRVKILVIALAVCMSRVSAFAAPLALYVNVYNEATKQLQSTFPPGGQVEIALYDTIPTTSSGQTISLTATVTVFFSGFQIPIKLLTTPETGGSLDVPNPTVPVPGTYYLGRVRFRIPSRAPAGALLHITLNGVITGVGNATATAAINVN
jgi:hypothetical protein